MKNVAAQYNNVIPRPLAVGCLICCNELYPENRRRKRKGKGKGRISTAAAVILLTSEFSFPLP